MFPLIGGLISGGASLLGSMFSSNTSAENSMLAAQTSMQNNREQIAAQKEMLNQTEGFNAAEAQKSRDFGNEQAQQAMTFSDEEARNQRYFEEMMSNSAYQRASRDMQAAGLNPMMMFGSGSMSSTPSVAAPTGTTGSGGTASIGTPSVPQAQFAPPQRANPLAGLGDAVGKAFNSALQVKTLDKMTDEIANLQTQRGLMSAVTAVEGQKERLTSNQADVSNLDWVLRNLSIPSAKFSAKQAEDLNAMPDWARNAAVVGSFLGNRASDALSPISSLAGSASKVRSLLPSRSTTETTRQNTDDGYSTFEDRYSGLYR